MGNLDESKPDIELSEQATLILKAAEICGGRSELAKKLKVHVSFINQLIGNFRPIPVKRCVEIETAVNGAITKEQLRPDVFR